MRVLIGSVSFYPSISGVAVSTHLLAKYLAKNGHSVAVITSSQTKRDSTQRDRGIVIYRLAAFANPFRSGSFLPYNPTAEIKKIIKDFKPDIIHIHDPTNIGMVLLNQARLGKISIVATNHFTFDFVLAYLPKSFHQLTAKVMAAKLTQFYNQCDALICPSQTIADFYKKIGVKKPIFVVSNGVDTKRFQPVPKKSGQKIVLYVGRIDKDKSLDVLIKALAKIPDQLDARFVLAGSGDLYEQITRTTSRITFTGPIDHESQTLVKLYQRADVFVMPSSIESQSIATMEAMAAGKPVVAARAQALPELVKHKINGYLFAPGDSAQMAKYIIKLIKNKSLASKMGAASRRLAKKHDLIKTHQKIEKIYKNMVD